MGIALHEAQSEFTNATKFRVFENEDQVGNFDMGIDQALGPALLWLSTYPLPGRGKSGLVIGGFISKMGQGNDFVVPDITHGPTWEAMAKLHLLERAYTNGSLSIVNSEILSLLPIIHILESGKIHVNSLDIVKRNSTPLDQIYKELIESPDAGPSYFDTIIRGET